MLQSELLKYQNMILFLNYSRNFVCNTVKESVVCMIFVCYVPRVRLSTVTGAERA